MNEFMRRGFLPFAACCVAALCANCSQYDDPNVPEPIHPHVEPEFQREYVLYRPSSYDRAKAWPLVVVCHGGFPDSPAQQIRHWTQLAEQHGFIVAAPRLTFTSASTGSNAKPGAVGTQDDDGAILAVVRHVRASHNISEDRVLIHGWSAGATAALRAGLANPQLFRAISVFQPRFDPANHTDLRGRVDPFQPVFVHYQGNSVLTAGQSRNCVAWLRAGGADVKDDGSGPATAADGQRAVEFFEFVIRSSPWLRMVVEPSASENPREIKFRLVGAFKAAGYDWEFGDGDTSKVIEPIHAYRKGGRYRASVTVAGPDGREVKRTLDVMVP